MTKKNNKEKFEKEFNNPKLQKLFQNLLKVTYEYITGRRYFPQSKESLSERLRIHSDHGDVFDQVIENLKESGKIVEREQHIHPSVEQTNIPQDLVRGSLKVHPRGFGFVEVVDLEEDVFIPKPYINGAIDGDVVDVWINPESKSEKGPEGKVISIVLRNRSTLVGTVHSVKKNYVLVLSALLGSKNLAQVEQPENEPLIVGDRIQLEVTEWGSKEQPTTGKLLKKIGNIEDASCDTTAAILENGIRDDFPKKVLAEALSFGTRITKRDLKGRVDLTDLECFTIDPDTAKDYDDAVSLVENSRGYVLGVHIADVSHYVQAGSALDVEAQARCNSTYFPDRCVPMLPHELSDNLCSLREGVIRLTVSVFIHLDKKGNTKHWEIVRSYIRSKKRFTYKQAKKILDGQVQSAYKPILKKMVDVCMLLKQKRAERGSVQLYMPELFVHVDEKGAPTHTEIIQYDITHQMIEEFMLKANEIVAIDLSQQKKELTFRVHEEPAKESLREFSALVNAFGYCLPQDPSPIDIQQFFVEIESSSYAEYLATCYIKSMRLACYSPDNIGHYGLSLEHYCHFTSPIRRYVDLVVHRLLFEERQKKEVIKQICKEASERERISARAEGSVAFLKKIRLLKKILEAQPDKYFEAIITRIKAFGVYFDILELMFEGFLHISELQDDYFIYNDESMHLKGKWTHAVYKAGDRLLVRVSRIDLISQEVTWEYVAHISQEHKKEVFVAKKSSKKRKKN